MLISESEA